MEDWTSWTSNVGGHRETSTKPKQTKHTTNEFRGKQEKTAADLAKESRDIETKKLRAINREKKKAAMRKPAPPVADKANAVGAAIVAQFPWGGACTRAQFDVIVSEWAKKNNMPIEQAEKHLAKKFNDDAQAFVNAFAGLLSDKSEAWREPEQSISYENNESIDGWQKDEEEFEELLKDD